MSPTSLFIVGILAGYFCARLIGVCLRRRVAGQEPPLSLDLSGTLALLSLALAIIVFSNGLYTDLEGQVYIHSIAKEVDGKLLEDEDNMRFAACVQNIGNNVVFVKGIVARFDNGVSVRLIRDEPEEIDSSGDGRYATQVDYVGTPVAPGEGLTICVYLPAEEKRKVVGTDMVSCDVVDVSGEVYDLSIALATAEYAKTTSFTIAEDL